MTVTKSDESQENTIELKKRIGLLLAAYGITLLLLIKYVEGFILFPGGLFYFFAFENIDFFLLAGLGWAFYLAITLSIVLTKHKRAFTVLYLILVFLLIINVSGCTVMQHELEIAFPNP